MYMNKVFNIAIASVAVLVAALVVSCSNETDTTLTSQQSSISKYLTGSHKPRLIAEADIPMSLDDEPPFYSQWGLDIYRYIATYYDDDRESRPRIEAGDKIEIVYSAYIFNSSQPTIDALFATNDATLISELEALGLNTSYEWTTDALEVTVGSDDLLQGLSTALEGCYEGDVVEVYLTFEAGYGNKYVGMVPSKAAQAWFIDVKSVTKK